MIQERKELLKSEKVLACSNIKRESPDAPDPPNLGTSTLTSVLGHLLLESTTRTATYNKETEIGTKNGSLLRCWKGPQVNSNFISSLLREVY
jgi:hypothetical protein